MLCGLSLLFATLLVIRSDVRIGTSWSIYSVRPCLSFDRPDAATELGFGTYVSSVALLLGLVDDFGNKYSVTLTAEFICRDVSLN